MGVVNFRISAEDERKLDELVRAHGVSRSEVIRRAMREAHQRASDEGFKRLALSLAQVAP